MLRDEWSIRRVATTSCVDVVRRANTVPTVVSVHRDIRLHRLSDCRQSNAGRSVAPTTYHWATPEPGAPARSQRRHPRVDGQAQPRTQLRCVGHELDGATAATSFCRAPTRPTDVDGRYLVPLGARSPDFVAAWCRQCNRASSTSASDGHRGAIQISACRRSTSSGGSRRSSTQADALRAKRRAPHRARSTLTQSIFVEMFGDPVTNPPAGRRWRTTSPIAQSPTGSKTPGLAGER